MMLKPLMGIFLFCTLTLYSSLSEANRTDIHSSAGDTQPLLNGQMVPDVDVTDIQGNRVNLRELVMSKPTILFFYRGGWCPYCNIQMGQLQQIESDLTDMGYQLIGISPDSAEELSTSMRDRELSYTLLSDRNLDAMRAFGLAFYLSDDVAKTYRRKIVTEFATDGTSQRIVLPAPAVYLFNTQGLITFQYVNPNYKVRVEPKLVKLAAELALN